MKRPHPSLTLLIVAILAYGLLIPQLGFYWDDLPISWIRYQLGAQALTQYFSSNRPLWGWLYQITTHLIPQVPIYWQLFALFWRWLNAVTLWAIARILGPERERFALVLAAIFLVYPGFNQQSVSFLYSHFFIVLFFYLISLYLMLRGATLPALLFSALNLWMMEYFFVLELARPFVLWLAVDESVHGRARLARTWRQWAPYLAVFTLAVFSRIFIFNNQIYQFNFKAELIKAPVATIVALIQTVFESLWTVTLAAWALIFHIPDASADGARTIVIFALVVGTAAALILLVAAGTARGPEGEARRVWKIIGLGAVLLLLGGPAFWLTNVPVSLGFPANRATLSFMLGSSFVLAGALELIPPKFALAITAAFIALAAGRQFLWGNEFRRDWAAQKNLFWQLTWRAPGLKPNTIVLMNEQLAFDADNSLSATLNWIYAPQQRRAQIPYVLFYPTNRYGESLPQLAPNIAVHYDYLIGSFDGSTTQTLVFYYAPPRCLRLLDPQIDAVNHLIPDASLLRDAASLSSSAPILVDASAQMPAIYGPQPAKNWCYYFEKAELARQLKDWTQVVAFANEAAKIDDHPNDPLERFVFIEGFAHTGDWQKAVEWSQASYQVSKNYVGPLVCLLWKRIATETDATTAQQDAIHEIRAQLQCAP